MVTLPGGRDVITLSLMSARAFKILMQVVVLWMKLGSVLEVLAGREQRARNLLLLYMLVKNSIKIASYCAIMDLVA